MNSHHAVSSGSMGIYNRRLCTSHSTPVSYCFLWQTNSSQAVSRGLILTAEFYGVVVVVVAVAAVEVVQF